MFKIPDSERQRYIQNYREIFDTLFVKNNSKYLVQILELKSLENGNIECIDMELCSINLKEFIQRNPADFGGVKNIWQILLDMANGIEFIHGCNVIHGDVKPSNGERLFLL